MWRPSVHFARLVDGIKTKNQMRIENEIKTDNILFFDMDGTLIDTNYANFLAYKKAIELVKGINCNIVYNPSLRFNRSLLKTIIPDLTETELEKIIQEKEECYNDFLPETQLNDNVVVILQKYFRTNKTVLVTNCRKNRALATLNYHGLTDKFSNLFFRQFGENDKKVNKFQNAISYLGVSPKSIIVFENEEAEIKDAHMAGIQNINVINP